MEPTDYDWQQLADRLEELGLEIAAWPAAEPDPDALRCEFSRHRTLAHLRAAQETWLEAALLFAEKENPRLVRPHPWRLFQERGYESIPWTEHRERFLADREAWLQLIRQPDLDRNRGGKLSGKPCTIATLTEKLVGHESHHVSMCRSIT